MCRVGEMEYMGVQRVESVNYTMCEGVGVYVGLGWVQLECSGMVVVEDGLPLVQLICRMYGVDENE